MKKDELIMIAFMIIAFLFGAYLGNFQGNRLQKEAISLNYAEYNSTNGNWQWKTNIYTTNSVIISDNERKQKP